MKLIADIANTQHALEVRREAGARVSAEVDGRRYELGACEVEPGVFLLTHEGRVYECRVASAAHGAETEVTVGTHAYMVTLRDPRRLRATGAAGAEVGGRVSVKATMPGKVVRVLVAAGAQVEAGTGLVVVEAMKMQNEMKSPKSGTVVELHAQPGATVNAGDVLVVVE